MKGRKKREIPEKTRRPTASFGTIPKCKNPVTRPRIEPRSPWWEESRLTAHPPRPPGASVAERFSCSPLTKAIRVKSPTGSLRIFAFGNSAGR
ncbi:hypothetical protein PR048_012395 [Dryococelus australis]|uniref:Uncharacterized protein n=1 Tax=Dryococelus australis TaxID=614101 RepID=A0ABQ9HP91_9NEOP|nr:hypothetical protein PR048_012395 [Dryococelus australis]